MFNLAVGTDKCQIFLLANCFVSFNVMKMLGGCSITKMFLSFVKKNFAKDFKGKEEEKIFHGILPLEQILHCQGSNWLITEGVNDIKGELDVSKVKTEDQRYCEFYSFALVVFVWTNLSLSKTIDPLRKTSIHNFT